MFCCSLIVGGDNMSKKLAAHGGVTARVPEPKAERPRDGGELRTYWGDEFYTKMSDIEAELNLEEYREYFYRLWGSGGWVILPADTKESNFCEFFTKLWFEFFPDSIIPKVTYWDYIDFESEEELENIRTFLNSTQYVAVTNPPFSLWNKFAELFPNYIFIANNLKLTSSNIITKVIDYDLSIGANTVNHFYTPEGKVADVPCIWLNSVGIQPHPKPKPKPKRDDNGILVLSNREYLELKDELEEELIALPVTSLYSRYRQIIQNRYTPEKKYDPSIQGKHQFTKILWRHI